MIVNELGLKWCSRNSEAARDCSAQRGVEELCHAKMLRIAKLKVIINPKMPAHACAGAASCRVRSPPPQRPQKMLDD